MLAGVAEKLDWKSIVTQYFPLDHGFDCRRVLNLGDILNAGVIHGQSERR